MKRISQFIVLTLAVGMAHAADLDLLKNSRQLFAIGKKREALAMCRQAANAGSVEAQLQLAQWLSAAAAQRNPVQNPKPNNNFDGAQEKIDGSQRNADRLADAQEKDPAKPGERDQPEKPNAEGNPQNPEGGNAAKPEAGKGDPKQPQPKSEPPTPAIGLAGGKTNQAKKPGGT